MKFRRILTAGIVLAFMCVSFGGGVSSAFTPNGMNLSHNPINLVAHSGFYSLKGKGGKGNMHISMSVSDSFNGTKVLKKLYIDPASALYSRRNGTVSYIFNNTYGEFNLSEVNLLSSTVYEQEIELTNNMMVNSSYMLHYNIMIPGGDNVRIMGAEPGEAYRSTPGISKISPSDWEIGASGMTMSWETDLSNFISGHIAQFKGGTYITMTFGTFTSTYNETQMIPFTFQYGEPKLPPEGDPTATSLPLKVVSPELYWNGNAIGKLVETANGPDSAAYPNGDPIQVGIDFSTELGTAFMTSDTSKYYVNRLNMTWKDIKAVDGNYPGLSVWTQDDYYQNHQQDAISNMSTLVSLIVDAFNAAGIPVPNVAAFLEHSSEVSTKVQYDKSVASGLMTIFNAGYTPPDSYTCGRFGEQCFPSYNSLGYNYGFLDLYYLTSYWFGLQLGNEFKNKNGGNFTNPVYNYIEFSSHYIISSGHSVFNSTVSTVIVIGDKY